MRPLLKLQGISWFLRQAITLATISLHTVQTPTHPQTNTPTNSSPASPSPSAAPTDVVITIQNVANMGLKGTTEIRHLDWQWREHWDYIWGQVRGRCGFKATRDVVDERLREGWMEETLQGECIQEDAMAGGDEEGKGWESTMVSFVPFSCLLDKLSPSFKQTHLLSIDLIHSFFFLTEVLYI